MCGLPSTYTRRYAYAYTHACIQSLSLLLTLWLTIQDYLLAYRL